MPTADVTTTVAFPMPDIVWDGPDTNIAVPAPDSPNFLDFRTTIDGQPVAAENEQKAFAKGVDITARLAALGVPLAPQSDSDLEGARRAEAGRQGRAGEGGDRHPRRLRRRQGLGASSRAELDAEVELLLDPDLSRRARTRGRAPLSPERRRDDRHRGRLDDDRRRRRRSATRRSIASTRTSSPARARRRSPTPSGGFTAPLFERRIAYVLTTGANWAGPIGDFRLTIDKGEPDSLVSFCADGVKKIGPTTVRGPPRQFHPDPRSQRVDPLSAAEERLRRRRRLRNGLIAGARAVKRGA